jgi:hypothetical protein
LGIVEPVNPYLEKMHSNALEKIGRFARATEDK